MDSLTNMKRLRLLKVYTHTWSGVKLDLPDDFELYSSQLRYHSFEDYPNNFELFSSQLRYLSFGNYPLKSLRKSLRKTLRKFRKLRLLEVYRPFFKVDLPEDFELSSYELRYLHFVNYPLKSLPTNFHANNLVELNLPGSNIIQLWKDSEVLLLLLLLLLHQ